MKHRIIAIASILFFKYSATGLLAQISIGGGYSYGTGIREGAPQVRLMYTFDERWSLSADANYYLDDFSGLTFYDANLNANYILLEDERFHPYVLAGANCYMESLEGVDTFFEYGLNLGTGLRTSLARFLDVYAETRYALGDARQFSIGGGLLFRFGGRRADGSDF